MTFKEALADYGNKIGVLTELEAKIAEMFFVYGQLSSQEERLAFLQKEYPISGDQS